MNVFQKAYDAIRGYKCRWFNDLMEVLQNKVLWPALQIVGQTGKDFIVAKIKEAATNEGMSGEEKFRFVFDEFRREFTYITISNYLLQTIIQLLYATFKETE